MKKIIYASDIGEAGYTALAEAIVEQACIDYIKALQCNDQYKISSIRKFFRSQWCNFLLNIDGEYLIKTLERKYGKFNKSNDKKGIRV